jgi:hypothetical protein
MVVERFGMNGDRNDLRESQAVRPTGGAGATEIGDTALMFSIKSLSRALDLWLKATRTTSAPMLRGMKSARRLMCIAEGAIVSSSRSNREVAFTILPSVKTADR